MSKQYSIAEYLDNHATVRNSIWKSFPHECIQSQLTMNIIESQVPLVKRYFEFSNDLLSISCIWLDIIEDSI